MNNDIELSVVLPCLDEEESIGICIKKIQEVFLNEKINGEIVVADNGSVDKSREIALSFGVKVVLETQKGYGAAYLRGLKEAKGKYIIIADSDNTYDFYDMPKLLSKLREGYDFVIGSRFKGEIHQKAMPWLNRYVGNPILSGMCRLFFRTRLSDIHCGMRAFSLEAYHKMRLMSLGMEFATEMVVAALQNGMKIYEIPIEYYEREGKSKLNPFSDAWRHIRFMLLYCPVWLYFIPGLIGFLLGICLLLLLLKGPFLFLGHYWDIHVMVFASVICVLSYQLLNLGVYAHTFAIGEGFLKYDRTTMLFQRHFTLEKGLIVGVLLFILGLGINTFIFIEWFSKHFGALYRIRESILAMTLLVIGLQTIFSSFFIDLLLLRRRKVF
ncbi:MAG: glycosyltransferase family 2 protein [Candidatus Omnitrophica bacterium]|nr:glycosyltransferase family 2 protein [Candidatus Omnitrophota bacterium]